MTKNRPRASVIIPAYNAAGFIAEALDSVFAQTFSNFEVIIVNDGSPDTAQLERVMGRYADRTTYLRQENRGPSAARNAGILVARSEYIAFLDSDDAWLSHHLSDQMAAFDADGSLELIYADALLTGQSSLAGQTFMQTSPSRGPVTFDSLLRWDCNIITSTVVVRRDAIIDAGLFDEDLQRCEDYDLWLRLAHGGIKMRYQEQVHALHRLWPGSLASDLMQMNWSRGEVLKKTANTLPLTHAERELLTHQTALSNAYMDLARGKEQLRAGQYRLAGEAIERANAVLQSQKLAWTLLGLRYVPTFLRGIYSLQERDIVHE